MTFNIGMGISIDAEGVPFSILDVSGITRYMDARDTGTITQTNGSVSQWDDKISSNNATQSVGANQPIYGLLDINNVDALTLQKLPDATQGSDPNEGFTATGIAHDTDSNTIWAGNIGIAVDGGTAEGRQLVELSMDGSTNISEITITHLPQGVSYDDDLDLLYYAASNTNKVYKIEKNGTGEGVVIDDGFTSLNGLAYDTMRGEHWLSDANIIYRYSKSGVLQQTINPSFNVLGNIDHLAYREDDDTLYVTWGVNGGMGQVYVIDCTTGEIQRNYSLTSTYSIEGVIVRNGDIVIASNGYYHAADIRDAEFRVNQLQTYKDTTENAQPALYFDGSTSYMDWVDIPYEANTIFAVHQSFSSATNGLIENAGTSGTRYYIRNQYSQVGAQTLERPDRIFNTSYVQMTSFDIGTSDMDLVVNDGYFATRSITRTGIAGNVDIGRSPYNGSYWSGLISVLAIWDRIITTEEKNNVGRDLALGFNTSWSDIT